MLDSLWFLASGAFWAVVAMVGLPILIACIAAWVVWSSPTPWIRHLALQIGIGALAFTLVFGLGARSEKAFCEARFAAAEAKFKELNDKINQLTQEYAAQLAATVEAKDKERQRLIDAYEDRLKKNPSPACELDDADLDSLQHLERKSPPAGKR